MIICPKQKLGFVHIYKTGGSSLTRILSDYTVDGLRGNSPRFDGDGWQGTWHINGQQHSKFHQNKKALHGVTTDDWAYMVVCRDPYDWFASVFYEFYATDKNWLAGSNFVFGKISKNRTFEDYIDFYRDFRPGHPEFWGFSTQKSFVSGIPEQNLRIVRFEQYEENLRDTLGSVGIPVAEIRHDLKRGSAKDAYKTYLRNHPRYVPFVNEVFAEDFDFFGYEKENAG